MSGPLRQEAILEAIRRLHVAGDDHAVPILQAAYRGELSAFVALRTTSGQDFKRWMAVAATPAVAVAADDDHADPDGPDTWLCARQLIRWAAFIVLHGAAGHPDHYRGAIRLARANRRLLLIECSSRRIADWSAAAQRWARGTHCLIMQPPPGMPHPSLGNNEQLH